ncbi:MAG: alcohol dehydrogenase catalytic domain-containing protein [candidate division Zixibacteria bacterium]|nr:alcohol dehydrogenase catalytic domain-containing protein [candidate division Zixibacteria bacterium]
MRAAVYYNNRDVRVEERPIPMIGPKEILVKIMASGVCGSDVMEWYRIKKAPRVLGHEIAGEVAQVGAEVTGFAVGDRVFVTHHVPCNQCRYCLAGAHSACRTLQSTNFDPGGFAEYVRVPEINVQNGTFHLPHQVTYDQGTFIEPLGCVIRGQRIARVKKGDTVLIIGSGIAGLLHIKLARVYDAAKVIATDINAYRLEVARSMGADVVLDAGQDVARLVKETNDGRGADVVIVCATPESAFQQAFEAVDRAGTLLLFAPTSPEARIPLPLFDLYFKLVTIVFSYAAVAEDLKEAIALLHGKKLTVDDMVTHRLPLAETQKGFALVAEADRSIKVIIEPQK